MEMENISLCSRLTFPHGTEPWGLTPSKKWNLALTCWPMEPKLNSPNINLSTGRGAGEGIICVLVCGLSVLGLQTTVQAFQRRNREYRYPD